MKRKLIAILAAVTLLCSVFVGMTFSASAVFRLSTAGVRRHTFR